MTAARTIVFFPEGAFGPTNNCVGIGSVLRERGHRVVFIVEESFAGTLEAKGFEERLMRLGPAPESPGGPGPVLEGLHPRHRAGLPDADDRPAGRVHRAHLAGAGRRREVRPSAPARDLRRARPGRDRGGQRRRVPGPARVWPAVGADRLVQPGRAPRSRRSTGLLRLPGRRSLRLAGVPGRVPSRPCRPVGRLRCVLPGARRTGPARRSERAVVHPRVAGPQPVPLPGRGGLRPGGPVGPDLASSRVERPRRRDAPGRCRRARRRDRAR